MPGALFQAARRYSGGEFQAHGLGFGLAAPNAPGVFEQRILVERFRDGELPRRQRGLFDALDLERDDLFVYVAQGDDIAAVAPGRRLDQVGVDMVN